MPKEIMKISAEHLLRSIMSIAFAMLLAPLTLSQLFSQKIFLHQE